MNYLFAEMNQAPMVPRALPLAAAPPAVQRGAALSECRRYRWNLSRFWARNPRPLCVIGLNPSTADETTDDPTVRSLMGRARKLGFGGLLLVNLFAFRATDPHQMMAAPDPVGPHNDLFITQAAREAGLVICAWGAHGRYLERGRKVAEMLLQAGVALHHLGLTKKGQPRHPLYLSHAIQPTRWDCGE